MLLLYVVKDILDSLHGKMLSDMDLRVPTMKLPARKEKVGLQLGFHYNSTRTSTL